MIASFEAQLLAAAAFFGVQPYELNAFLAITLVAIVCGAVGALVVGNRMSFFSDAMAHCSFAGLALGLLTVLILHPATGPVEESPNAWVVTVVMIAFGAAVGSGIAYLRQRTNLAADAIIGVFFALAVGFGAMLIPEINKYGVRRFDPEAFLFGSPIFSNPQDLLFLLVLLCLVGAFVLMRFNASVFASFSPSLSRSRGVGVVLTNYLFVVLLSLVVNLSIKAVGVLLINALLVVPAASAANIARTVRSMFWFSVTFSLGAGWLGYLISRNWTLRLGPTVEIEFRTGGTIVVLTVVCFVGTYVVARFRGRSPAHGLNCEC
jgi:zinc transport system permease protein